jgi:hypothetical protein
MEENKALSDFIKRVKSADIGQLYDMKKTIKNSNLLVTIIAMTLLMTLFYYPNVLTILIIPIVVILLAMISNSFDNGIRIINERIDQLDK